MVDFKTITADSTAIFIHFHDGWIPKKPHSSWLIFPVYLLVSTPTSGAVRRAILVEEVLHSWDLCHLIPIKKQNSLKCININHIPFTINIYLCHINSSVFCVLTCINSCFCFWPFLRSCHLPIFGAEKPYGFHRSVTQMTSYLSVERSVAELLERRLGRLGRLVKRSV